MGSEDEGIPHQAGRRQRRRGQRGQRPGGRPMKLVIAATGASGAIYLQRLLDQIDAQAHEVHLVLSPYARQVINEELGDLRVADSVKQHGDRTMNVPFVSGSTRFDAMIVVPCSMGTLARIAAGTADSTI